jgi:hypothetical protein
MEAVLTERVAFDLNEQKARFKRVFAAINAKLGETAFVKFRGRTPVGGLAPAYFEVVSIGAAQALEALEATEPDLIRDRLSNLVQTDDFREATGPGANNRTKLKRRIELVRATIVAAP